MESEDLDLAIKEFKLAENTRLFTIDGQTDPTELGVWNSISPDNSVGDVQYARFSSTLFGYAFFLKMEDFVSRVTGPEATRKECYKADLQILSNPGRPKTKPTNPEFPSLLHNAWDETGRLFTRWPTRGIFVEKTSTMSETDWAKKQLENWVSVITLSTRGGAPRLWYPRSFAGEPLKLYIERLDITISDAEYNQALAQAQTETAKHRNWMTWEELPTTINKHDLVLLSVNPVGHYASYLSLSDFQRLIRLQTKPKNDEEAPNWNRPWPPTAQLLAVQSTLDKFSQNGGTNTDQRPLATTELVTRLHSKYYRGDTRGDPGSTMGQSANQLGNTWWSTNGSQIAEWLHRSAFCFGPRMHFMIDDVKIHRSDIYDAQPNLIFGTFEANSDMTRAEKIIRDLLTPPNSTGLLSTRIVNSNSGSSEDQLEYVNYQGVREVWALPSELANKNWTWFAPKLLYKARVHVGRDINQSFTVNTQFYPFSRYQPLVVEAKLDKVLLQAHLFSTSPTTASHQLKRVKLVLKRVTDSKAEVPGSDAPPDMMAFAQLRQPESSNEMARGQIRRLTAIVPGVVNKPPPSTSPEASYRLNVHPNHFSVWRSIQNSADHVKLDGLHVEAPRIVNTQKENEGKLPLAPAAGFMVEGEIKLFGLDSHRCTLQSWHGPPPSGTQLGPTVPRFERISIDALTPAEFLPLLKDTQFSQFTFRDVHLIYQNALFVKTNPIGMSLSASVLIDESHGALYATLRRIGLKNEKLMLSASAFLGQTRAWDSLPIPFNFHVRGGLQITPQVQPDERTQGIQVCDGIYLTQLEVLLAGVGRMSPGLNTRRTMDYGFGISGKLNLAVPGSITPLEFDFEMSEFGGVVQLVASLSGDVWSNAFGTKLSLTQVHFTSSFSLSAPSQSLDLSLNASIEAGSTYAELSGIYTPGGNYKLSAAIKDLGCDGILNLFRHITGDELQLPNHADVMVGSAVLEISNETGFKITVDKLGFDNYSTSSAEVKVSSSGVLIQGSVESISFPEVPALQISQAFMRASFEKTGSRNSTDVALGGKIQLTGEFPWDISAAVHLYKVSGSSELAWTVYGVFEALGQNTTLGRLFPQCQGTFLTDIGLSDLAFIAASHDDPILTSLNPQKYPIRKGIQISAMLGEVDQFSKLLRTDAFPGLALSAAWTEGSTFDLSVTLPTSTVIHLGDKIKTDPIAFSIDLSPESLGLRLQTGIQVPVPNSPLPLDFQATLKVQNTRVSVDGEMKGNWVNPFGISEKVSIGPNLSLGLGINLETFFETGIPDHFDFSGGLQVGSTSGSARVSVNDDTDEDLLNCEIDKFSLQDVVSLARQITKLNIPIPPNFVYFEAVKLYMSTGITIDDKHYPAGFSFDASLKVFDTSVKSFAQVSGGELTATGNISSLRIGALHISGRHSNDATLDLIVGSAKQHLKVDGALELLGVSTELTLNLDIMPKPVFSFDLGLRFTDLLVFVVQAKMKGELHDINNLSELSFTLHAYLEQHILEHVKKQVLDSLETLRANTNATIESAKAAVTSQENGLQENIQRAQSNLDKAYQSWLEHSQRVHDHLGQVIQENEKQMQELEGKVMEEKAKFDELFRAAENGVKEADAARATRMRADEAEVSKAKSKWESDVKEANERLEGAKNTLHEKFGAIEQDLKSAEDKVNAIQSEIDDTQRQFDWCNNVPLWSHPAAKAELLWLGPKLETLKGYKWTADHVLEGAKALVHESDHLAKTLGIPALELAVEQAGKTGSGSFQAAQDVLQLTDQATHDVLSKAKGVLEGVQHTGDAGLVTARAAVEEFAKAEKLSLQVAQLAVDDLTRSAEWSAYQLASGELSLAKHSTHALDLANAALSAAETASGGFFDLAETLVEKVTNSLNIKVIELDADLEQFLGKGSNPSFSARIQGDVIEKPFEFTIQLDMRNTAKLAVDLCKLLIHEIRAG